MKTLQRAILVGGSIVGAALLVASVSFACSLAGHRGAVWFCSTTSCTVNLRAGTAGKPLAADSAYFTNASNLTLGGGTAYKVKYVSGQNVADDCKNGAQLGADVVASGAAGGGKWTGHPVSSTPFSGSPGAYTLCATAGPSPYNAASIELYFWSF